MLFSSVTFVGIFLPISLLGYYLLSHFMTAKARLLWLVACSLFFYSYWLIDYLPILIGSIAVNFIFSRLLQSATKETGNNLPARASFAILIAGISLNLALLGYFKYYDFAIENFNQVAGTNLQQLNLLLPLAISFFTFQQIAYLVDSYKGIVQKNSILHYTLFVSFFPQLIAGPIVHHSEMMPQFMSRLAGKLRWKNLLFGVAIFGIGLFKKLVLADTFAVHADLGYANHENMTIADAWITTLSYTFQLYFDFSGYSDMAIGAARMFGINLPLNFFSPYKSRSIQEFWRRWHMTLSRFLRDYIYIPLGGNRVGEARIAFNLVITFLLGGIWHGAGWTFIIWGAIHGGALVFARTMSRTGLRLPGLFNWALTFLVVHVAWVFFRAENVNQAFEILQTMFGMNPDALQGTHRTIIRTGNTLFLQMIIGCIVAFTLPNTFQFTRDLRPLWKNAACAVLFGLGCVAMLTSRSEVFLYFNF